MIQFSSFSKDLRLVTSKTKIAPSLFLKYYEVSPENFSCPAVSRILQETSSFLSSLKVVYKQLVPVVDIVLSKKVPLTWRVIIEVFPTVLSPTINMSICAVQFAASFPLASTISSLIIIRLVLINSSNRPAPWGFGVLGFWGFGVW